MEILNITNYNIGSGIEVEVKKDGEEYRAYLQLPDCGDSQHSFLDETDDSWEDEDGNSLLTLIVAEVQSKYSNLDLIALTEIGTLNYESEEEDGSYVIVDKEDDDNFKFMQDSPYSSYYNTFLLKDIEDEDYSRDENLRDKLNSMLKTLVSK